MTEVLDFKNVFNCNYLYLISLIGLMSTLDSTGTSGGGGAFSLCKGDKIIDIGCVRNFMRKLILVKRNM